MEVLNFELPYIARLLHTTQCQFVKILTQNIMVFCVSTDSSPSPNRKDGFLEPPIPSNAFRRRNSAPGDPEVEGEGHKNELGVSTMPRTRSSTSLSELIQQDASPSLQRKSDAKNRVSEYHL